MQMMGIYRDGEIERRALVTRGKKGVLHVNTTFAGHRSIPLVSGLRSEAVISRSMNLPLRSKRAALEALPFQLESSLPGDLSDFIVSSFVEKVGKEEMRVDLHACLRSALAEHIKTFSTPPDFVSTVPVALARFLNFSVGSSGVVCHMGEEVTDVVGVNEGKVVASVPIPLGRNDDVHEVKRQLERAFYVLDQKCGDLGGIFLVGNFSDAFSECGKVIGAEQERLHAVAIGLALDALSDDPVDFQRGEMMSKRHVMRLSKKVGIASGVMVGAALFVAMVAMFFVQAKEKEVSKTIAAFAQAYEGEMPQSRTLARLRAGKRVSANESLEVISKLHRGFLKGQNKKNYYEDAPSVAALLDQIFRETSLGKSGGVIESIDFSLESYPTLQKPQEKYSAVVVLQLQCDESVQDELKKVKMIDQSREIEWQKSENGYQARFAISK